MGGRVCQGWTSNYWYDISTCDVVYALIHMVYVGPPREEKWAAEYISEVDDRAKGW